MIVTLGEFIIANGVDRTLQRVAEETLELQQQTQVVTPARGAWQVAFPERAARSIPLSYKVTFPPCLSVSQALIQSRMIMAQCPTGGVLVESWDGDSITYAAAWVNGAIRCERIGVTNVFTFAFQATNPTATSYYVDVDGELLTDADGNPYSA